ncbi:MAG TPA: hypothetical protein VHZ33_02580 [Trebonia sp.]|jgi:hypothetical protein|nr:hypothetical protein [Trebonia sp.]
MSSESDNIETASDVEESETTSGIEDLSEEETSAIAGGTPSEISGIAAVNPDLTIGR